MSLISLGPLQLGIAALLLLSVAALSLPLRLRLERPILVAATRSVLQLLLIGLILEWVFTAAHPAWIGLITLVMLAVAGYEVRARQKRPLRGAWGYGVGTGSMFVSSFGIALLAVTVILGTDPWYRPQYLIPLLGMLLGNTMTGIAVALDRLTETTWQQRATIEARLMLGETWATAIEGVRRDSLRAGLIPIVNAMSTAGVVSLPGMMTGQILAGAPPLEAAKYQILILFLIGAGTGLGATAAVHVAARRLFDQRERLRLDRLRPPA